MRHSRRLCDIDKLIGAKPLLHFVYVLSLEHHEYKFSVFTMQIHCIWYANSLYLIIKFSEFGLRDRPCAPEAGNAIFVKSV